MRLAICCKSKPPKTVNGEKVLIVTFELNKNDKVIFVGANEIAKTTLFKILMGEMEPDAEFRWGVTTSRSYLPKTLTIT